MSYWQLLYHVVWATKHHQPLLTGSIETEMQSYLRERCLSLGGSLFALNGLADHVHMVVAIPPRISVAAFVGQVKSSASARYNRRHPVDPDFAWQHEYGVYSCDRRRLPNLIDYVERQPQIHAQGQIIPILERIGGEPSHLIGEPGDLYYVDSAKWRREMMALDTDLFD